MKKTALEKIGFYTLSDERARNCGLNSPMWRCELILTNRCNFKCPYCRGLAAISEDCTEDMPHERAIDVLNQWIAQGLKNVRFSGGEPTLYPHLLDLVHRAKEGDVGGIAVSTNGSAKPELYLELVAAGVNDFSVSLDTCCAAFGDKMAGTPGCWEGVVENIKMLSKLVYVNVGVVVTPETAEQLPDTIRFAHNLGVRDIRVISSAQWNQILPGLDKIEPEILEAHPILKYRVENFRDGLNVRGIDVEDCHTCHLAKDDSAVAGKWHFPCVIYMREGGKPIGEVGPQMRAARCRWSDRHNSFEDPICRQHCLDVYVDYNNRADELRPKHYLEDLYKLSERGEQIKREVLGEPTVAGT